MIQKFHFSVFSTQRKQKHKFKKIYMHPYIHCNITNNSQNMERAKCPTWIDKEDVVCIHTHTHTVTCNGIINQLQKKNEILPFGTAQMDLENIKVREKNWIEC